MCVVFFAVVVVVLFLFATVPKTHVACFTHLSVNVLFFNQKG